MARRKNNSAVSGFVVFAVILGGLARLCGTGKTNDTPFTATSFTSTLVSSTVLYNSPLPVVAVSRVKRSNRQKAVPKATYTIAVTTLRQLLGIHCPLLC
jgi:hypothetical protein